MLQINEYQNRLFHQMAFISINVIFFFHFIYSNRYFVYFTKIICKYSYTHCAYYSWKRHFIWALICRNIDTNIFFLFLFLYAKIYNSTYCDKCYCCLLLSFINSYQQDALNNWNNDVLLFLYHNSVEMICVYAFYLHSHMILYLVLSIILWHMNRV